MRPARRRSCRRSRRRRLLGPRPRRRPACRDPPRSRHPRRGPTRRARSARRDSALRPVPARRTSRGGARPRPRPWRRSRPPSRRPRRSARSTPRASAGGRRGTGRKPRPRRGRARSPRDRERCPCAGQDTAGSGRAGSADQRLRRPVRGRRDPDAGTPLGAAGARPRGAAAREQRPSPSRREPGGLPLRGDDLAAPAPLRGVQRLGRAGRSPDDRGVPSRPRPRLDVPVAAVSGDPASPASRARGVLRDDVQARLPAGHQDAPRREPVPACRGTDLPVRRLPGVAELARPRGPAGPVATLAWGVRPHRAGQRERRRGSARGGDRGPAAGLSGRRRAGAPGAPVRSAGRGVRRPPGAREGGRVAPARDARRPRERAGRSSSRRGRRARRLAPPPVSPPRSGSRSARASWAISPHSSSTPRCRRHGCRWFPLCGTSRSDSWRRRR